MDGLSIREQLLVNHFVFTAGCVQEQAMRYLQASHWQLESALSMFFNESSAARQSHTNDRLHNGPSFQFCCAPTNTPVTPPNFPDALAMLAKMSTTCTAGDSHSGSPSCASSPPNSSTTAATAANNSWSFLASQSTPIGMEL